MTFTGRLLTGAALISLTFSGVASAATGVSGGRAREAAFDASISSADQTAWLKDMSSAPNHVGSPHDKANAEKTLALFKSWGWDAHIETFQVLYPTPISTTLEMVTPQHVVLGGQEPAVPGDPTSAETAGRAAALCRLSGRRRRHRAGGLCELRHARRL